MGSFKSTASPSLRSRNTPLFKDNCWKYLVCATFLSNRVLIAKRYYLIAFHPINTSRLERGELVNRAEMHRADVEFTGEVDGVTKTLLRGRCRGEWGGQLQTNKVRFVCFFPNPPLPSILSRQQHL